MKCLMILFVLSLSACTTIKTIKNENLVQPISQSEYARIIRKNTAQTNQYSGFYQTFQADMTQLNSEVITAGLRQRGHFMQWDNRQYQIERDKALQESSAFAKFFMRFFVPEKDYDDLHKGKTIWKVFLEYGGSRFEGKVRKMSEKLIELQTLYPQMDRFSTPYEITFNVPMATIEGGDSKVILSSSLGSAEFLFPAKK